MCCHAFRSAQGSIHHLPVQRSIWPGLLVLIQLVWQAVRCSCALIVQILLACDRQSLIPQPPAREASKASEAGACLSGSAPAADQPASCKATDLLPIEYLNSERRCVVG